MSAPLSPAPSAPQPPAGGRVPRPLYLLNELLAFLLELLALGALAWWGGSHDPLALALVLGIAAPVAAAVLWGAFAAPRARYPLPTAGVLAVKALVFGAALFALRGLGHGGLALVAGVVVVLNTGLATHQRARQSPLRHPVAPGE